MKNDSTPHRREPSERVKRPSASTGQTRDKHATAPPLLQDASLGLADDRPMDDGLVDALLNSGQSKESLESIPEASPVKTSVVSAGRPAGIRQDSPAASAPGASRVLLKRPEGSAEITCDNARRSTPRSPSAGSEDESPRSSDSRGCAKAKPPPPRKLGGLAPRHAHKANRIKVLKLADRFRQIRSIDIAAALFHERDYKTALSAAQRLTKKLVATGLLRRYLSDSGRTFYALSERGATVLKEEAGVEHARGTTRHSSDKRNPEHDLWSAFYTIACIVVGLDATCESELAQKLWGGRFGSRKPENFPVQTQSINGRPKGQMPDAVAVHQSHSGADEAVWFEIDRSMRGSARLFDLARLIETVGSAIDLVDRQPTLRRVVVACKTERAYVRNIAYVTGIAKPAKGGDRPRVQTGSGSFEPALRPIGEGRFAVFLEHEVQSTDGHKQVTTRQVGLIEFRMLPTWLPGLTYRDIAPRMDGWFNDKESPLPFWGADRLPR